MKYVTLLIIDRNSSKVTSATFGITKDLKKSVNEFRKECGYSKYYEEFDLDEELTAKEKKWMEDAELDVEED